MSKDDVAGNSPCFMRSSSSDGKRSVMTAILMSTDTYMHSSSSDGKRSVMTAILMSTDTYICVLVRLTVRDLL